MTGWSAPALSKITATVQDLNVNTETYTTLFTINGGRYAWKKRKKTDRREAYN